MHALWPSQYLLLGLLAEQPMHGYELARLVLDDETLRAIWHLKRSEVYYLLGKLVAQGHITEMSDPEAEPTLGKRQASGPPRQIYSVTATGRAALDVWLTEPVASPRDLRAPFLAKLYLARRRDLAGTLMLLERQCQVLRGWQDRLRGTAPADPFLGMVHKLRLAQVEAALNALEEIHGITVPALAELPGR